MRKAFLYPFIITCVLNNKTNVKTGYVIDQCARFNALGPKSDQARIVIFIQIMNLKEEYYLCYHVGETRLGVVDSVMSEN